MVNDPIEKKIDAAIIATPYRKSIKNYINNKMNGIGPKLVAFLANNDPSAKIYAEWTAKACLNDGIQYELREINQNEMENEIKKANEDPMIHGILIYYPCFGDFPSFYGGTIDEFLRDSISIQKDVEGLCHYYRGNLYRNNRYIDKNKRKKCVLPCTPLAIVKILEYLNIYNINLPLGERLKGKRITIINRSDIVGRPLAAMLANDGADVYSADINTLFLFQRGKLVKVDIDHEECCKKSNIIITGVPSKNYKLNLEWIQPGTSIINISNYKNIDEEGLLKIPNVTYIPMVGKVTVAMLERNLMRLYENFHYLPELYWQ